MQPVRSSNSKQKKKSLIRSIMLLCSIIVMLSVVCFTSSAILSIKSMYSSAYKTYEQAKNEGYNTEIKSEVQSAISILQGEYDRYLAGEKSEEEAQHDAKESVRAMRYRDDASGYFWIDATDYTLIMHPILTENEGNNRYELEDQNGVMIVQEIVKTCTGPEKGGYNSFDFTKSDGVTVAPKIAYSELFEPWQWIISTGNYVDDMKLEMDAVKSGMDKNYAGIVYREIAVFFITTAISLLIAFIYGKKLVLPLKHMQAFADRIATGDLTSTVDINTSNEIGQTSSALLKAQDNMRSLLLAIDDVIKAITDALTNFDGIFANIRTSFSEVCAAVETIAENITEQASSTASASQEANIMSDSIVQTVNEVRTLEENTNDMKHLSEQSMATINQLITANDKTKTNIDSMHEQAQATNKSVQQIQIAANLINEIADQTSLLALNASIEAARAGEMGRGFAVVADEIGKLAQQSTDSVEEIRKVVDGLLQNASQSVAIMEEISTAVDLQVNSISDTSRNFGQLYQALDSCVSAILVIDHMTDDIETQRSSVTTALETLNRLAQDNAAMTQETASMSTTLTHTVDTSGTVINDLKQKVQVLADGMHKFKL